MIIIHYFCLLFFFFFKQKTAYEMRISDWSSDVCSSDLAPFIIRRGDFHYLFASFDFCCRGADSTYYTVVGRAAKAEGPYVDREGRRSEEHTSELQSLMRISYAVFCLKKKKQKQTHTYYNI